jgi:hypothetical protein
MSVVLHLLSGKQPLKTENLNCILEIVNNKILYIFYISCRCTIKFAFAYYGEKIAMVLSVIFLTVNIEQSVMYNLWKFYPIEKSMSALKSMSQIKRQQVILYCIAEKRGVHCNNRLGIVPPQPGCHKPNSLWPGIIKLFSARESLGTEKSLTFFTV